MGEPQTTTTNNNTNDSQTNDWKDLRKHFGHKKQYTPVILETNKSNYQSITNLSLKEFTDLSHPENRKWLPETRTQSGLEVINRTVKRWDGIGSEERECLEVPVRIHSIIHEESRKDPEVHRKPHICRKTHEDVPKDLKVLIQPQKVSGDNCKAISRKGNSHNQSKNKQGGNSRGVRHRYNLLTTNNKRWRRGGFSNKRYSFKTYSSLCPFRTVTSNVLIRSVQFITVTRLLSQKPLEVWSKRDRSSKFRRQRVVIPSRQPKVPITSRPLFFCSCPV